MIKAANFFAAFLLKQKYKVQNKIKMDEYIRPFLDSNSKCS